MPGHVMGKTKNGEASNGVTYPEVALYSVLKVVAGLKFRRPLRSSKPARVRTKAR